MSQFVGAITWAVGNDSLAHMVGLTCGTQVDVNTSSHCANLAKLHFSHVSLFSGSAHAWLLFCESLWPLIMYIL